MGKYDYNYGVVLDAGSSGTRAYVYKWKKNSEARKDASAKQLKSLPELITKKKWTKKVRPGVSTFGTTPEQVGPDHLKVLLDHALEHVPKNAVKDTPIFVLATAGMRLLPDLQRKQVLKNICSYIQSETDFLIPDCELHVQVIPGDTEGLYGWIAANYLLGGFDAPGDHDHGKGHHTYGFLDMGGASAQIAFAPNVTEAEKHANDLKLVRFRNLEGHPTEYRVFVTTWLGFGVNEARRRYTEALTTSYGLESSTELPDPCLPNGLLMSIDGKNISSNVDTKEAHFIGTGKFGECLKRTFPLLEKEKDCPDKPCLINGVHVPGIDFDVNHFVGISEYWHTTHEIFEMGFKDKAYDFNTYQKRVKEFCEQSWSTIEDDIEDQRYGKKVNKQTAYEVCFKASWLINVLHDGIGVPRVGLEHTPTHHNGTKEVLEAGKDKGFLDPFQAVNEIKETEISWTMGKMLLYASADVPSATTDFEALPVGFGTNEVGVNIPSDFEYPGGGLPGSSKLEGQSITDQISSTIFRSDASHRFPGFIFFLLIIVIAVFCLCGRDRRARFYTKYVHTRLNKPGKPPSHLSHFLHRMFRGRTPSAEFGRDLEDGSATRLYDPSEFELGDMNSSDDETAPKITVGSGYTSPTSSRQKSTNQKSVLGHLNMAGRLSPDIVDRRGLALRTESRENLTSIGGRKSRSGSMSPTRLRNAA